MKKNDSGLVGPDGGPVSSADDRVTEAEQKAADAQEQLLRVRADFDNTRKRLEREKLEAIKYANERLLSEILPIVDNLDRAMTSISEGHDPEKVKQGLKLAQGEIHQILETHGVEVVQTKDALFDPRWHEAVAVTEREDIQDGTIIEEIQRGYTLNGRLIRPSRVKISQRPSS